jgi:hypothetical protein
MAAKDANKKVLFNPQMNADKHRYFLAFACGEANNKHFYLCLSVFICVYLCSSVDNIFFLLCAY